MLEKRKLKRQQSIYYLKVYDRTSSQMIGRLVDIHTEGLRLVSEKPLKAGKDLKIRMDLPCAVGNKDFLEMEARSVWCDLDKNPDFYDTGLRITSIDNEDRKTINSVFEEYSFSY